MGQMPNLDMYTLITQLYRHRLQYRLVVVETPAGYMPVTGVRFLAPQNVVVIETEPTDAV